MGFGVDKKGIALNKENSMMKRKRLRARAFREWHESLAKKHKRPTCGEISPERSDTMLHDGSDSLETSCSKKQQDISKFTHAHCKEQSSDPEVKSRPGNVEATNKKNGVNVQGFEQESLSTSLEFHEKSVYKMIEDVVPGNKEFHSANNEKCKSDGTIKDEMKDESNCSVPRSDELSDSKPDSPTFSEYWVPVEFSYLQLEKYCETLVTNSALLCSSKKGNMDLLHDVLRTIRMCCDHPYLVDPSLEKFVNEGRSTVDNLSTGIEASGKLALLDKFLQDFRKKQLRVLIVFQSNNSKSLRHILDDFICRRFGEESYVHVYREFDNTKKRAALDLFNDTRSGRFVVLIEKSSCQSSIRLSSVDFVILFNSDWCPVNDMKALQKMSIQAQRDHVKVLRLYSANTVEEKVLISAKEGFSLDSSISYFSHNICHMLLLWGTSYLFTKLDDFHSRLTFDNLSSSVEQKLLLDVLHELSGLLSCQNGNSSCLFISEVPEARYVPNISLYGEKDASCRDDDIPHVAIWVSLLEGLNPKWKLLPGSSVRVKRRGEYENKNLMITTKNMVQCRGESVSSKPRARKAHTSFSRRKSSKLAGHPKSGGSGVDLFSCIEFNGSHHIKETFNRRMKELVLKQKKDIREFYRIQREKRAKLDKEHQSELDLSGPKYGETAAKQQELKKLDDLYKGKIETLNREMDIERKNLEDIHWASRKKEKQLKDRLLAFSARMDVEGPIPLPSNAPSLNSELQLQTVELVKRHICSPRQILNSVCQSENQCCEGVEQEMVDGSLHCDSGLPPNQSLEETGIVPIESNGENESNSENESNGEEAALTPRVEASNTAVQSVSILVTQNRVSGSTSLCEKPCLEVQLMLDMEIEGDGSTNMEPSATLPGVSVHLNTLQTGSLSQSCQSHGENGAMESSDMGPGTCIKLLNDASNLCLSDEHQLLTLTEEKNMEPSSIVPYIQQLDRDNDTEVPVGTSNGRIEFGGMDSTSVARQPCEERESDTPAARLALSSSVLVQPDSCKSVSSSQCIQGMATKEQPRSESQQCASSRQKSPEPSPSLPNGEVPHEGNEMESNIGRCDGETEGRSIAGLGTVSSISRQETVENLGEIPSSRLSAPSCVSVQPQACTIMGNSPSIEEPTTSTILPSHEIRWNASPLTVQVLGCQTISPLQSSVAYDIPPPSNVTGAPFLPPDNSYSQETSSLRSDVSASTSFDPLRNELVRMRKEEEEAIKVHIDKVNLFKSACAKEIQEIQKKYDLLVQEAENTLLQKKKDLQSHYEKVRANKILAETMIQFNELMKFRTQESSLTVSQQLSAMLHQTPDPRPEPTVPTDPFNITQYPLAGYQTQGAAPHLSYNPISFLPISHNPSSFYGMQNQLPLVPPHDSFPRSNPIDHRLGLMIQHEGCQENPILL